MLTRIELDYLKTHPVALALVSEWHELEARKAKSMEDLDTCIKAHENRARELKEVSETILKEWEEW